MIGNDVIDLCDPETRSRHDGFDARVFGETERRAIARAPDPHVWRQLLWAAKESAYKAARRADPSAIFSPIRFAVTLRDDLTGCVVHPGGCLALRVECSGDCVHALAGSELPEFVLRAAVATGDVAPGRAARRLATRALARHWGVPQSDLSIERVDRRPELRHRGRPAPASLSLSHHGRYAAFAALPRRTLTPETRN
jgi:phosphopantetheinyl transferase (holo-ACP synthase)